MTGFDLDVKAFEIAKLNVMRGDTVIVRVPGLMMVMSDSPKRVQDLYTELKTNMPYGVKVLLLDKETELSVVHVEDRAA